MLQSQTEKRDEQMNVLMIHGVNFDEDHNPNFYDAWADAISTGIKSAGYTKPIATDPLNNSVRYNDIFDDYSDDPGVYAEAIAQLLADWFWRSVFGPSPRLMSLRAVEQPGDGFSLRWTAGIVAQWVVEAPLRKECCDRLNDQIAKTKPDVIFAHSLGSLLCYDFLLNDPRGKTSFNGIFVTFGSQIGNPFVVDNRWGGKVRRVNVKAWYNLYNPYDPVFVEPIDCQSDNYTQFTVSPPFGTGSWFNFDGHQVTEGDGTDGDTYPGYLDNSTTKSLLWPLLTNGTMGSLLQKQIRAQKLRKEVRHFGHRSKRARIN
jgi:metacaspase-1